jgi:predicted N-formylglutamate amidohydrolase
MRRRRASRKKRPIAIVVTCEHGGNRIPAPYRRWFRGRERLLETHRAYDPGALALARALARRFRATLVTATVSRLVVELNRSPAHRGLFSDAMLAAPPAVREDAFQRHYVPYRRKAEHAIDREVAAGRRVLHMSSHSFTPKLDGSVRRVDIALLYDPSRRWERSLCDTWRHTLREALPGWTVRRNYPYRGVSDGFTRYLRTRFADSHYAGVELEVSQKHVRDGRKWARIRQRVADALAHAIAREGEGWRRRDDLTR